MSTRFCRSIGEAHTHTRSASPHTAHAHTQASLIQELGLCLCCSVLCCFHSKKIPRFSFIFFYSKKETPTSPSYSSIPQKKTPTAALYRHSARLWGVLFLLLSLFIVALIIPLSCVQMTKEFSLHAKEHNHIHPHSAHSTALCYGCLCSCNRATRTFPALFALILCTVLGFFLFYFILFYFYLFIYFPTIDTPAALHIHSVTFSCFFLLYQCAPLLYSQSRCGSFFLSLYPRMCM